ncbi:hypothetical protein KY348_02540 [Candidatus Woesearchaeota archaeon]|nr:hypothetical protein [Candidatus Woesearchaeota archaeon]
MPEKDYIKLVMEEIRKNNIDIKGSDCVTTRSQAYGLATKKLFIDEKMFTTRVISKILFKHRLNEDDDLSGKIITNTLDDIREYDPEFETEKRLFGGKRVHCLDIDAVAILFTYFHKERGQIKDYNASDLSGELEQAVLEISNEKHF